MVYIIHLPNLPKRKLIKASTLYHQHHQKKQVQVMDIVWVGIWKESIHLCPILSNVVSSIVYYIHREIVPPRETVAIATMALPTVA